MPVTSDLAELYEAVFGTPPSQASSVALRRMQEFLGLKRDDAFSRMLIVQLRCADQIEQTRLDLHQMIERLTPLLDTARTLNHELDQSVGAIARRNRHIPAMEHAVPTVEVYGRPLPLLAYLAHAFQRRGRHDALEVGERIAAARIDAGLLTGVLALAAMAGALLDRFG